MTVSLVYGENHSFGGYESPPFDFTPTVVDGDNLLVIFLRADFLSLGITVDGSPVTPLSASFSTGASRDTPLLVPLLGMTAGTISLEITGGTYCNTLGIYVLDMNGYDLSAVVGTINFAYGYRSGRVPDRSATPKEPFQDLEVPDGGIGIAVHTTDPTGEWTAGHLSWAIGTPGALGYREDGYCTRSFAAQDATDSLSMFDTAYSGDDMVGFSFAPAASGGISYTLTADAGSFAVSGQAAGVKAARKLPVAAGSFAIVGQAATARAARKLSVAAGFYAVTGQATALLRVRRLTVATGSFALSGQSAALRASRRLVAGVGAIAVTGQPAILRKACKLTAAAGSFSVSGQAAGLRLTRRIAISAGPFAISGIPAGLKASRRLTSTPGSFAITGIAATLTKASAGILPASPGSFAITGQAVALRVARRLSCSPGALSLQGNAAAMRAARNLPVVAGSFAISGAAVSLRAARVVRCQVGAFTVFGPPAAIVPGRHITASSGQFLITGIAASFQTGAGAPLPDVEPFMTRAVSRSFSALPFNREFAVTVRRIVQ